MNDHEDGPPNTEAPEMLPEPTDPELLRDTEPPTGTGHSTPIVPMEPFGFPRPPATGEPILDMLLTVVTELRDGVRALTEEVRRMGTNHDLVSKSIQNFGTNVEGLRTETKDRFEAVEGRIAALEQRLSNGH